MAISSSKEALTEEELSRLSEFLKNRQGTMNIEELDGLFAALIAGPDVVLPSEYLPIVFAIDVSKLEFADIATSSESAGPKQAMTGPRLTAVQPRLAGTNCVRVVQGKSTNAVAVG